MSVLSNVSQGISLPMRPVLRYAAVRYVARLSLKQGVFAIHAFLLVSVKLLFTCLKVGKLSVSGNSLELVAPLETWMPWLKCSSLASPHSCLSADILDLSKLAHGLHLNMTLQWITSHLLCLRVIERLKLAFNRN